MASPPLVTLEEDPAGPEAEEKDMTAPPPRDTPSPPERPEEPVPMSADSDAISPLPPLVSSPSSESWAPLYGRACGSPTPRTKRVREPRNIVEALEGPTFEPEKRPKRDALLASFVQNKNLIKEQAPRWNSQLKPQVGVATSPDVGGMDAALSAWVAYECDRVLGQELSAQDERLFEVEVSQAKCMELEAWRNFKAFCPIGAADVRKPAIDTRRVLTWKMKDGVKSAKARFVAMGLSRSGSTGGFGGDLGMCKPSFAPPPGDFPQRAQKMAPMAS